MTAWYDQRPGRNDPCPCGSDRKMKRCCRTFFESRPVSLDNGAGVFIHHQALWFGERTRYDDLVVRLGNLPGPWFLRLMGMLHWLLRDELWTLDATMQRRLIEEFSDPITARKVAAWLTTARAQRVFHRCTTLAMMQLRLITTAIGAEAVTGATMGDVMRLALRTNDFLERDYELAWQATGSTEASLRVLGASFFRNGFYSHQPHWGAATARHWALLGAGSDAVRAKLPSEWYDIPAAYQRHLGGTPQELMLVVSAIVAHYENITNDQFMANTGLFSISEGYFSSVGSPEADRLCAWALPQLSATWEEHVAAMKMAVGPPRENVQQFFSIYDRPLLRDGRAYSPLDVEFLRCQTTEGWYWTLVRTLRDRGVQHEIPLVHGSYGHAFEWWCATLVRDLRSRCPGLRVWTDWDGEIPDVTGFRKPDIVIQEGDRLFVFEVTSVAVQPAVAVSCNPGRLGAALRKIWCRDPGKLAQLEKATSAVADGHYPLNGLDISRVRRVQPVFVTLRYLPRHKGTWHWFRELMRSGGLGSGFVESVVILDAEDLEELCSGAASDCSMGREIDAWKASKWGEMAFEDYKAGTVGARSLNPVVSGYLEAFFGEMRTLVRMP